MNFQSAFQVNISDMCLVILASASQMYELVYVYNDRAGSFEHRHAVIVKLLHEQIYMKVK